MLETNNSQFGFLNLKKVPLNKNLVIIVSIVIIGTIIIFGSIWFFVQNKNPKNADLTEQSNNTQLDNQYSDQNQSEENFGSVLPNFEEKIEGNLKIYTNFSKGIQFAYNKAWQANRQEGSQNPENLLFNNLPEGDSLEFYFLINVDEASEKNKILREGVNNDGFKYQIIPSFSSGRSEEEDNQKEVLYLSIVHSINEQFKQPGIHSGMLYQYMYTFPRSKGESYLNQVVSELETIAKSFKYLYHDAPYFVTLPGGKKLSFEYTVNFELISDQDGMVTLSAKDYSSKIKFYYNKPVNINTTCLSEYVRYPIKLDNLTAEYRAYTVNEVNQSQCSNVSGTEVIEVALDGEKVFLEFNSSVLVDDRILLLIKSMKLQP
jgi:hypothetical protein